MARIRSLKPEIWLSAQVMRLSLEARLLFIGLITQADDEGRGSAEPRRIKAAIFGGDDITSENVRRWLDELVTGQLITLYHSEKHGPLYSLITWKHHQKIDRPKQSGYPSPPDPLPVVDESTSVRRGSDGSEGSDRTGSSGSEGSEGPYVIHARARETGNGKPEEGNGETGKGSNGEPGQQSAARLSDEAEHAEWETVAALYPPGAARVDWLKAEHAARILVERGDATWQSLREGTGRYAAHVRATNRMVLNPARFFTDHDRPWSQAWPLPTAGASPQKRMRTAHEIAAQYPEDAA